jgi:thiol-disulfide isomerase/thioredoxin
LQPVVGRLEEEFGDRMRFVRVDFDDPDNRALARKYAINGVPYVLMLDGQGKVIRRRGGNLNPAFYRQDVLAALAEK